jgi:hypothetical protein
MEERERVFGEKELNPGPGMFHDFGTGEHVLGRTDNATP